MGIPKGVRHGGLLSANLAGGGAFEFSRYRRPGEYMNNGVNSASCPRRFYPSVLPSTGYSVVNGRSAISLALLMARVRTLWWDAQVPVVLLGRIFPLSEMYLLSLAGFL